MRFTPYTIRFSGQMLAEIGQVINRTSRDQLLSLDDEIKTEIINSDKSVKVTIPAQSGNQNRYWVKSFQRAITPGLRKTLARHLKP